jgi:arylformamidase
MTIYDITRTVSPGTHVWPGDNSFGVAHVMRRSEGSSVNLTALTMSAHTGTHADAYYHYDDEGAHPLAMPLDAYLGSARVVTVDKTEGELYPGDFEHTSLEGVQRILVHSHVSDLNDDQWPEAFPYLSVELIEWLSERDVRLIGLDSPSVDAFDSKELPCHHTLKRLNMVNLETLQLRGVPDGDYELIALPLKLDLACGSPVRAILRTLE